MKIGQQSLDQEFMVSQNALLFVNTMFGWAMLPSADMPGGGPAYPLSALGVRGRVRVANSWTLLAGVFNGRPWQARGDAQEKNSSGTSFPAERRRSGDCGVAVLVPFGGTLWCAGTGRAPLPRVYKFGVWHDTAKFDDQRFDNAGMSLADPASAGAAANASKATPPSTPSPTR